MRNYSMTQPQRNTISGKSDKRIMSAICEDSEEINYNDVEIRSKILAQILWDSGCRKNDPICCVMNKSTDFLIVLKSIDYADCINVPINPDQPIDHIQSVIFDSGAEWLIADRKAQALLKSDIFKGKRLNIGWMDSIEKLPDNCFPEFVRDNIDHVSLRPVLHEVEERASAITFYSHIYSDELKKQSWSKEQIEKFTVPILEFVGIDSNSKVAGLMDCDSPSVLLEAMTLFNMGSRLFYFTTDRNAELERLIDKIQQYQITYLLLGSDTMEKLAEKSLPNELTCSGIDTVLVWGDLSSENSPGRFREKFPNATVFKVVRSSERRLCIQVNKGPSSKFTPVASIPFTPEYLL